VNALYVVYIIITHSQISFCYTVYGAVACRTKKKAEDAIKKLSAENDNAKLYFIPLDLASFGSVRQFAKQFNVSE